MPLARAVETVTSAAGCFDSFTSYVPVLPCCTAIWVGVAATAGPEATLMPTGVEPADAPRLSYAFATSEWLPVARPETDSVYGEPVSVPSSVVSS